MTATIKPRCSVHARRRTRIIRRFPLLTACYSLQLSPAKFEFMMQALRLRRAWNECNFERVILSAPRNPLLEVVSFFPYRQTIPLLYCTEARSFKDWSNFEQGSIAGTGSGLALRILHSPRAVHLQLISRGSGVIERDLDKSRVVDSFATPSGQPGELYLKFKLCLPADSRRNTPSGRLTLDLSRANAFEKHCPGTMRAIVGKLLLRRSKML